MYNREEFLKRLEVKLETTLVPEKTIEGENGLPDFLTPEGIEKELERFDGLLKSGIIDRVTNPYSKDGEER